MTKTASKKSSKDTSKKSSKKASKKGSKKMRRELNAKLVAFQKLRKVVAEASPVKAIGPIAKAASKVLKEVQAAHPNKSYDEQVNAAIETFKGNPKKYL